MSHAATRISALRGGAAAQRWIMQRAAWLGTFGSRRERYTVVAPQGLGDTLEATPFLQALRRARPGAHITAIALRSAARDLLVETRLADDVVLLPYWDRGTRAFVTSALLLPLRRRSDAVFLMYPAARPVYLVLLALVRARRRFAHRYTSSVLRTLAATVITQIVVGGKHNVLRNFDLFAAAGIEVEQPTSYVVPAAWLTTGLHVAGRIIMHVGTIAHTGLEARRWPEASFAELGRRMEDRGFNITVLAGPAEMELSARVAAEVPNSTLLSLPLVDAARLVSASRAVVANDNGIAHVAAGCGTPVLALFGPTPVEHGPFGATAVSFRPSPCPPCFDVVKTDSRCKLNIDYACLKRDLTVDDVERRLLELLSSTEAMAVKNEPSPEGGKS